MLDYGCGDGTFLARIRGDFPDAIGADTAGEQIVDCVRRFGPTSTIRFVACEKLSHPDYAARFEILCCMTISAVDV